MGNNRLKLRETIELMNKARDQERERFRREGSVEDVAQIRSAAEQFKSFWERELYTAIETAARRGSNSAGCQIAYANEQERTEIYLQIIQDHLDKCLMEDGYISYTFTKTQEHGVNRLVIIVKW